MYIYKEYCAVDIRSSHPERNHFSFLCEQSTDEKRVYVYISVYQKLQAFLSLMFAFCSSLRIAYIVCIYKNRRFICPYRGDSKVIHKTNARKQTHFFFFHQCSMYILFVPNVLISYTLTTPDAEAFVSFLKEWDGLLESRTRAYTQIIFYLNLNMPDVYPVLVLRSQTIIIMCRSTKMYCMNLDQVIN